MEKYDYLEAVTDDVIEYINDNGIKVTPENRDDITDELLDTLFCYDPVTGNESGSYTFNAWQAGEYLCHNMGLLFEACDEFGCIPNNLNGAEACDVTIRCYLLPQAIERALNEVEMDEHL